MAFWSGEKLAQQLPRLISTFDPKNLDCASYQLSVGDQVFATSDKFASSAPTDPLVSVLGNSPNNILRIRPGQFAFIMTKESVSVPNDALALISMRAKYKFKGLINVSGFHVDPGWQGKLLFSVYNAGPAEVIIQLDDPMFLIVYADLDCSSAKVYTGGSKGQTQIKADLLQNMTEQVFSPLMLQRQVEVLGESVRSVETTATTWKIVTIVVTSVLTLILAYVAIFATFVPSALGVMLANTLEVSGYEVNRKSSDPPSSINLNARPSELGSSDSQNDKKHGIKKDEKSRGSSNNLSK